MFEVARDAEHLGADTRVFRDRCITVTWPTLANPQGAIVAHGLPRGCRQDKRFRRSIPLNCLLSPPGSSGRFTARLLENSPPPILNSDSTLPANEADGSNGMPWYFADVGDHKR